MKKMFFAALCCMTIGLGSALAQDDFMPMQGRNPQMRNMRQQMEQLADTAITNRMELTEAQRTEIENINKAYAEQMKAQMGQRPEKGKKMSKEEHAARMEQLKTVKKQGRKQLRRILGDELYIQYLEEAMDRQPMMMMRGQAMRRQGNGAQQGGFGRDGFGNEGFGTRPDNDF